jgi:hypothetical protein
MAPGGAVDAWSEPPAGDPVPLPQAMDTAVTRTTNAYLARGCIGDPEEK